MARQSDDLDAIGRRVYGEPAPATTTTTDNHGGLFPRDDDDMSRARFDAIAERMYR